MSSTERGGPRLEDYLTTIYRLEEALGEARITDIANELSVTPATVSKIIGKLERKGFVERIRYRNVKLTQPGREVAEKIIRKHRIAEVFLSKLLRFGDLDSHNYAHFLEHLPDIVIERIYEYMGRPVICPHGNLIPGSIVEEKAKPFSILSVDLGVPYTLYRVAGEFTRVLEFLHSNGISLGDKIKVIHRDSIKLVVEITESRLVEIPISIARFIYVN